MREIYKDTDPNNELVKTSFYSRSEGYAGFTKWVGYTQDSGRTFSRKFITYSNVNYNGNTVNLTFGFTIKGVVATEKSNLFVIQLGLWRWFTKGHFSESGAYLPGYWHV
jgi:hypothetical protein